MARFSPSRLLLVERSEPALYTVDRELCEAWPSLSFLGSFLPEAQLNGGNGPAPSA